jgi:hypothetical protein
LDKQVINFPWAVILEQSLAVEVLEVLEDSEVSLSLQPTSKTPNNALNNATTGIFEQRISLVLGIAKLRS